MVSDGNTVQRALSLVDQECSHLRAEGQAYEAFRERVSHTTPESSDATAPSITTKELLDAYRQEVMDNLDYETAYGDTLAESLEAELSPSVAQTLLSKKPLTRRRKRNLLVETTAAIERREEFCEELEDEREALEIFAEELADINNVLERLPACSARELHLEKLLTVWEMYDTLLDRCEVLLEYRQQQIRDAVRSPRLFGEKHARNQFLYSDLNTLYPVLSAIAATCDRIAASRNGEPHGESADRSIQ